MSLEYTVVTASDLSRLIDAVEDLIAADGWRPIGGIAVEANTETHGNHPDFIVTSHRYLQAMTKETK